MTTAPSPILPAERSTYRDAATGARVIKWTSAPATNQHFYFTSPSVTADDRWLVFISDRDGHPNIYSIDRGNGAIRRLSNNAAGTLKSYVYPRGGERGLNKASPCLDAARNLVYHIRDDAVFRVDLDAEEPVEEELCALPAGWCGAFTHISPDGRTLCVPCTDPRAFTDAAADQWEQMRHVPRRMREKGLTSRLCLIDTAERRLSRSVEVPFWVTHVQWDPAGTGRVVFNQEGFAEGTGHPPRNRIWCLETDGSFRPLSPESEGEWRSHENWTPTGSGIVYHGGRSGRNFLAERTWEGELRFELGMEDIRMYHATSTIDGQFLLVDKPDGYIALVNPRAEANRVRNLCRHGTSIVNQDAHAHPITTPGGHSFIFTSDRSGNCQVYEAKLPP
jgi:Tol biopolymer transport system component